MKKIILVILIAGATWWLLRGNRQLAEDDVRGFYRNLEASTLERKPDALCAMLDNDFHSVGLFAAGQAVRRVEQNKADTCDGYRALFDTWDKLGEKMGGQLQLDADHTLHSISFSADRKTATVDISTSLDVAGSVFNIRSRSTDTLIRRNGTVLLLRSAGQGTVGAGP